MLVIFKRFFAAILAFILTLFGFVPPSDPPPSELPLRMAPSLEVVLIAENLPEQRMRAAQLTTSWMYIDENGMGRGINGDAPHPLQLRDYGEITLQLESESAEFELLFSDDYPPQSVSVQRWDTKYIGAEDMSALWNGEPVEVNENKIQVNDDGCDYIYEVYARWTENNPMGSGSSHYAFRMDSAG